MKRVLLPRPSYSVIWSWEVSHFMLAERGLDWYSEDPNVTCEQYF
jgi:hypothetical protein